MMDVINNLFLSKITILLINVIACFLAFLVYKDNPRGRVNILYLAMTVLMFFWIDFAYLPRLLEGSYYFLSVVFLRIAWFATPIFFVILYLLTLYIVEEKEKYNILSSLVIFFGVSSGLLTLISQCVVRGLEFINNTVRIDYGPCMLSFLLTISFIIGATLFLIFRKDSLSKIKIQHFIVGVLFFCVANIIFNIILPIFFGESRFYFVGDYSILVLLVFTAYGILRYSLFNIKIVTTEILVFSIWLVLSIEIFATSDWQEKSLEIFLLILVIFLGILLIRSVKSEIKSREKMEKIAKQLKQVNRELKRLDVAKSEFISITSHQLRTPLTVIKGYVSMILEGVFGKINKELKIPLQKVYESNERLISLVEDFLNVSRIESGRMRFNFKECCLEDIVKSVIEELKGNAKKKGLTLRFYNKTSCLLVVADKYKIRQVIMNLVDNAIKYTNNGYVYLFLKQRKNNLCFCVVDSGIGIKKEDKIFLFKKFSRGYRGTKINADSVGLGLYIAKKIIKAHNGKIWADSRGKHRGSQFCFEIPITRNLKGG